MTYQMICQNQQYWGEHLFEVHPPTAPWSSTAGGIYMLCSLTVGGQWYCLYVGKAGSFKERLHDGHEKWADAIRMGMTHVHAMSVSSETHRAMIEQSLIRWLSPPLNVQHRW